MSSMGTGPCNPSKLARQKSRFVADQVSNADKVKERNVQHVSGVELRAGAMGLTGGSEVSGRCEWRRFSVGVDLAGGRVVVCLV